MGLILEATEEIVGGVGALRRLVQMDPKAVAMWQKSDGYVVVRNRKPYLFRPGKGLTSAKFSEEMVNHLAEFGIIRELGNITDGKADKPGVKKIMAAMDKFSAPPEEETDGDSAVATATPASPGAAKNTFFQRGVTRVYEWAPIADWVEAVPELRKAIEECVTRYARIITG